MILVLDKSLEENSMFCLAKKLKCIAYSLINNDFYPIASNNSSENKPSFKNTMYDFY